MSKGPVQLAERSLADLFGTLSKEMSTLIQQEALLARAELGGTLRALTRDAITIGTGAVIAMAALGAFTACLVLLMVSWGATPWIAALVVAAVLSALAALMITSGVSAIRNRRMTPVETVDSVKETAQWLKNVSTGTPTAR